MRWWYGDPEEAFWLEATDREDIGTDLWFPKEGGNGKENWHYSLFLEAIPGDVVFHYGKGKGIVGCSVIAGPAIARETLWVARGTSARKQGLEPYWRPGWSIPLVDFQLFETPISPDRLENAKSDIWSISRNLKSAFPKKPIYFPFELSEKRKLRPLQGYAFKLPKDIVDLFPSLNKAADSKKKVQQVVHDLSTLRLQETYVEGGKRLVVSSRVERNPKLRLATISIHGTVCQACGFDFEATYGEFGAGYIEVHHLRPVSTYEESSEVDPKSQMAVLCANCHRMVHRRLDTLLSLDELRAIVQNGMRN